MPAEKNTKKPLIGMLAYYENDKYYLNRHYGQAIAACGGYPVIMGYFDRDISMFDALVFTGSNKYMQAKYAGHAERHVEDEECHERDEYELPVIREALDTGKPILCICHGMQLLNCVCGGTLFFNIAEEGFAAHARDNTGAACHYVNTLEGTLLRELIGERRHVSSIHSQAVNRPGEGLRVAAYSDDGVIEAVEHESGLALGVQWHPERIGMTEPFQWLLDKCR